MEENNTVEPEVKSSSHVVATVVVLVILVAAGIGFYFLSKDQLKSDSSNAPVVNDQAQADSTEAQAPVKEFAIDGTNFEFNPKKITVNKGDMVRITFRDDDGMHNLVIDGYNVKTNIIRGGSEETIQFAADKVGSFEYYCSVGNHREQGMTGTLVVN